MAENKQDEKSNVYGGNSKSDKMDLQSRTAAALGIDTMKNLATLDVLIIGLRGVGVETAKNLILTGPKAVTLYDNEKVEMRDLGSNFFLRENEVGCKTRSEACTPRLVELNPYCTVTAYSGELTDKFIQTFGAVVITQVMAQKELNRINQLCRTRKNEQGKITPSAYILALTQGVTGHVFTDFGPSHVVTDLDGEPSRLLVIDEFDHENLIITVAAKRHGFDDGDLVRLEEVEGAPGTDDCVSIEELNKLVDGVKIRRIYRKYDNKKADGSIEKRERQVFEKFALDLSGTSLENKKLSKWKTGGLVCEIKKTRKYEFRDLDACMSVAATEGMAAFFGPQHPDQGAWEQGAGKCIHLMFVTALQFYDLKGHFMRLHNEDDSREFSDLFRKINESNKGKDGMCHLEGPLDKRRINAYSWYFQSELTGYCAFLGGIAAQEIVKKFGKYIPINQWLHCDHIQLVGKEVPSDANPIGSRYDDQISIFGKSFQMLLSKQRIFLVGTGALGCEYLKGLSLMGVCCGGSGQGQLWCTDMDHIEISNLSRQFLFRRAHVGKSKSLTAANAAKEMNSALNVEALEMKVWSETEDYFDDNFWDNLDLCWNALDNVHARKYTDNKCLLHSKPLLESGTQGTKCNSEVIIPFKTRTYNDGEEQETEGIPMCTLANFPYLPLHCIEWARSSFTGLFETQPKTYNSFMSSKQKFIDQVKAADDADALDLLSIVDKFVTRLNGRKAFAFADCIELAFNEMVEQHITRIRNLIYLFPADAMTKEQKPFWTGHKKFPIIPKFDYEISDIVDYLFCAANLWAFAFGVEQVTDQKDFITKCKSCNLKLPEWKEPVGLKIKTGDEDEDADADADADDDGDSKMDDKSDEIERLLKKISDLDQSKLFPKMLEIEFEKDDDKNFHIDYITSVANTRARNYRIRETSRHQCKIIAGKIIAALATTTAMICGLVELEFYKLKLGLEYINQDSFYNANINLAVSQFQFFEPDVAIKAVEEEKRDAVNPSVTEKFIPYPSQFTSWDTLVVDQRDLTVQEFVDLFPKLFWGVTVDILYKSGKLEEGVSIYNASLSTRSTKMCEQMLARKNLSENLKNKFTKQLSEIKAYNSKLKDGRTDKLVNRYVQLYGSLVSDKRNHVILSGSFYDKDGNIAVLPRIKYIFK